MVREWLPCCYHTIMATALKTSNSATALPRIASCRSIAGVTVLPCTVGGIQCCYVLTCEMGVKIG